MICVALTYTVNPTRTTLQLVVSYRDTECYPYIASIVSASPAPRVSALPRPDDTYLLYTMSLKVTCSAEIDAVAYAVTTEKPPPLAAPVTTCVPSDVGMTP